MILAEKIQDDLGPPVVQESKDVLKIYKMRAYQRDTGANLKELPTTKPGTI